MARRRFFVESIRGGAAELRGDEARHLTRVLRVEPGQIFEISDNHAAYLAEIAEARGDRVCFRILNPLGSPSPVVKVTLVASLIKFDHFEWMLEKATELGVERIVPVEAARSDKGLMEASQKRRERWARIARESAQQSRRVTIPEILPALRLQAALPIECSVKFRLEEESAPPFLDSLPAERSAEDRVSLLLGPEGGWTDAERRAADDSGWRRVSLGATVLRAETAAIAGLAVLFSGWMSGIVQNSSGSVIRMEEG